MLRYSSGRFSLLVPLLLALMLPLSSCTKLPLGGTNVAANTQLGKENIQQVVARQDRTTAGRDVVTETKQVESDKVDTVTINNQEVPLWIIATLLMGFVLWSYLLWKLPSPDQIWSKN